MLTSCKQCEQVIEIPTLNEHILLECEVDGTHSECERCGEPVPVEVFQDHVAARKCNPVRSPDEANRCPLCHQDTPPGQDGWKQHLLLDMCPENVRLPRT